MSAASVSAAPVSAEHTSGRPAVRISRRAICGAVRATKPIGPTATVVVDTSPTARPISASRERSTRRPSACAESSPSSSARSARPAGIASGSSTASEIASGMKSSQVRPLSEPSSQRVASWASSIRARASR